MKTKRLVFWLHLALIGGLLIALSGSLWLVQPVRADSSVLYVAPTAQGSGDCSSWDNACTLQTALTHAASGDEIWVKTGIYTPGSTRKDSFRIQRNNVQLYGGFAGTETAREQRDWVAHLTILSGDIDQNDTNTDGNFIAEMPSAIQGSNAYHVVYVDGTTTNGPITSATVIDGFTITAGNADGSWPNGDGGGLDCNGSGRGHACSPTLRNVTFSGNYAVLGGGMYNNGSSSGSSSPTLSNVTFSGNSSYWGGGGMSNYGDNGGNSSPTLTNVTFSNNTTATYGGGMLNYGSGGTSKPTLTNVTFSGNSAFAGGGMYNYGESGTSRPTLTNVTFSGNSAQHRGGGMVNFGYGGDSSPTLSNCILWGNTATSGGAQIYNDSASPNVSYSDIQGGCPSGATCGDGMLYTDPKFVNAAGGNLRLDFGSPAIDAGTNSGCPSTDLDGLPRPMGAGCDMGAYEFPILFVDASVAASGNGSSWPQAYKTLQEALTRTNAHPETRFEVWVADGTYTPGSDRTDSFRIQRNVQLYGGFAGTETSRDQRNWVAHPTILSGNIGTENNNSDNAYHVVYVDGVTNESITSATVIDGFTITAGNANGDWPDDSGGGLYCNGKDSGHACSPTLRNVTFSGNTATNSGGGMYNAGYSSGTSSPTLSNVTFSGNSAGYGGGMYNDGYSSGASSPTLTNVTFSGNTATYSGGGMVNDGSGNGTSSPTLSNCILWGNTATSGGTQIYNDSANPSILYSDIQGCGSSGGSWVSTCGRDDGGNIDADPLFVDTANGNLRLNFGSPAIDAGTNTGCPTTDLDGLPRPADGDANGTATCDMGAYEGGTMLCSAPYTFADQSGVAVEVVTAGDLACLYVDEIETNHPNATSGIQTGRYWLMRGLQNDRKTDATGFTVNLTLPTTFTPDDKDKVCRYTASGWDCAASGFGANSVTRSGITAFSDWAVGNNVGPTAVKLLHTRATPLRKSDHRLLLAGLAFSLLVLAQRFFFSKNRSLR
jgi:hypothetical protein